ncbi:hypothetical protein CDSM653_02385 [Caldanaerobacter subterraneus subsp. pacificus DSM 12653]|uniref:Uncharacterized protein n=1 Tax=Caldanaerobacter subterraneus subsp. pacificus DSM 12653 TaxID=391606 RepID=A0A0F5PIY5_9THEO|nr:hypothetical protein CDSM653_02385 [Caldanaerobacter subterraneus subsp. pacificus DSM 12653]
MFLAYLRGIETSRHDKNSVKIISFLAYLRGIETLR